MKEKVEYKRDHFLNDKQKKVKQKIMEDCLDGIFKNLQENIELFDEQSVLDLTLSILTMFNRDVLTRLILTFGLTNKRKQVMNKLFEIIREEVDNVIKKNVH